MSQRSGTKISISFHSVLWLEQEGYFLDLSPFHFLTIPGLFNTSCCAEQHFYFAADQAQGFLKARGLVYIWLLVCFW